MGPLRWWLNAIDAGTGSALPWHCVWSCVCVCVFVHFNHHHHDERQSLGAREKVPSVFLAGSCNRSIKFKYSRLKENGQTLRALKAIQARLNELLRFVFGVRRNAFCLLHPLTTAFITHRVSLCHRPETRDQRLDLCVWEAGQRVEIFDMTWRWVWFQGGEKQWGSAFFNQKNPFF